MKGCVNREIRRRTLAARIFPDAESSQRLARVPVIGIHEDPLKADRYLNMIHLKEHQREGG